MPIRLRKLIGAVLLLLLVAAWALLAAAFAQTPLIADSRIVAALYYVLVGLGWVLAGNAADTLDVASGCAGKAPYHAALTRRKPFHRPVAAPDIRTRTKRCC